MRPDKKEQLKRRRVWRVRKKIRGTKECPRMSVRFTNRNIHVQFIDDAAGVTLAAASTLARNVPAQGKLAANVSTAKTIGKLAAQAALAQGITQVVFDRGAARYHWSGGKDGKRVYGKLAMLAEAAREAGLKF